MAISGVPSPLQHPAARVIREGEVESFISYLNGNVQIGPHQFDEFIECLRGTCQSIEWALDACSLPEGLLNDTKFCRAIDERLFCCSECDWWCEIDEMADQDDDEVEPVCDECYDGELDFDD